MSIDDLSKQILADVVTDFRAKNLGTSALSKGYVGPSVVELEMKYCADGQHFKVDFDLALKQLEESKFLDTGPMAPFENKPGSQFVVVGVFSKREFVYLTEKGYKAAQKFTGKPRSPAPSEQQQDRGADADRKFARLAIDEARKSVPEDERPHPKVGAVVVKDGVVLCTAHRGEILKSHAEYIALDEKLSDDVVAGTTVYTTLEPCTTRKHPKIPCAQRLIDRKVARVMIGMLDPNPDIRGRGVQLLNDAGIETQLFPRELTAQVEEMNREFIRSQKDRQASAKMPTTDEDQSSWPDVILECQWPSLVHESKIPGSHIVRNRPWMLRYRGPGAVYNVCVHGIDFGEYKASFPLRVPTLTDTASVHPIICHKSDGLVITAHDLESLIQNPPSGCDVQQYAVQPDGNLGEEISLEGFIVEVEIPVTISYEDKNGNQFKIRYLLHYDTYMEKGEMIRIGRIEKVTPK